VTAVEHTHAPGNVGLRGDASCPACRAAGVTLTDEQRALVDELLAPLLDAGDVFYTTAGQDAVRTALIEGILRAAEQERARIATRLDVTATAYEQNARNAVRDAARRYEDDPSDTLDTTASLVVQAGEWADRAITLRRVTL
jgi:hypothetical protein